MAPKCQIANNSKEKSMAPRLSLFQSKTVLTKDRVYLTGCIAESSKQHFGKWKPGADSITKWISCKGTWDENQVWLAR